LRSLRVRGFRARVLWLAFRFRVRSGVLRRILLRRAAVGLVPAATLEHDGRRRHQLAWTLATARAFLEGRVGVRLDRGEHVSAVIMSLFKWDIVPGAFRGLDNYQTVLFGSRAEEFWHSLSVTLTYTLITVPVEIVVSLVLAYVLFQKMRGRGLYRALYFLPYITSVIAAGVIFNWLMNPNYGLFNSLLELVGIGPQRWLDEPRGLF